MPIALNINTISKNYDPKCVINALSLELKKGDLGCLLGESGCGKTTVLRCIAGFETIQSGSIRIDGSTMSTPKDNIPPENRGLGMIFQDYALFPHLTVKKNITFGLSKLSSQIKKHRVMEMLELVGLTVDANKYPHELSGGQQQRVALARALAPNPELLLMDEPFSNLDVALRERLCVDVRKILKEIGISALLVTHNQHEAFAMADVIGVMREGALEQWDTAYNLYHRPKSQYVADFVGEGTLVKGQVTADDEVQTQLGKLKGHFSYPCRNGCSASVLIRPEDIIHDDGSPLKAKIIRKRFRGANILYTLKLQTDERVLALVSSHHNHPMGQEIGIKPQVDEIVLFEDAQTLH
ncbi:MAG: ABC transporter ATP-binding protein [Deltaproteobacteria bacterium]|nr:ABC transporter ATP-binding protein [Deltaproteobacteria bacterium]MBW2249855.1 ABC transporter ATP-binding protein [Deltaproteobacteria bacterium]